MGHPVTGASNQRQHPRAQFFRLRLDEGFVPVFAFTPAGDNSAIAGLLMDLSEGGLQLVCNKETFVPSKMYDCTLVDDHLSPDEKFGSRLVELIWTHEEGMYVKSGFSFVMKEGVMPELIQQLESSDHHLLRCVLHPLQNID